MKRIILLVMCLLIAIPSLALANEKPRVGVVTVCSSALRNDKQAMDTLDGGLEKPFNRILYEVIPYNQSRSAFIDFADRKNIKDMKDLKRDDLLEFGKQQGFDYLLYAQVTGTPVGGSAGLFSYTAKYVMDADIKFINVNNGEAPYLNILTADAKGNSATKIFNDGMPKLMQKFAEQFKPGELVK